MKKAYAVKRLTISMPKDHNNIRSWTVDWADPQGWSVRSITVNPSTEKAEISISKDDEFLYIVVNLDQVMFWEYVAV
jgi:hypothetical protein